jgi:hypothetical protein
VRDLKKVDEMADLMAALKGSEKGVMGCWKVVLMAGMMVF